MRTIILAGGKGWRLDSNPNRIPKPLTKIGDIPIIEHIMNIYSYYNFNDFILCLGFKGILFKEYFKNYYDKYDMRVHLKTKDYYYLNDDIQDWHITLVNTGLNTATGSRIKKVKDYIGNETFCLTYGDGLIDLNINDLVKFHKSHGKLVTVTTIQPKGGYGVVEINNNNQIINFQEKPIDQKTYINAGYMVIEPEALNYIEDEDNEWWEQDTLPKLVKENQVIAYKHKGNFKSLDSPKDKIELEEMWNNNNAFWKF
jgi:glucose-1-phosphate cytidylyltransferase